jgi:hypothetical protein
MKVDKAKAATVLEDEYVNGCASLKELAERFNCTWPRLAQIGKELVPGYTEAAEKRKKHKFICVTPQDY